MRQENRSSGETPLVQQTMSPDLLILFSLSLGRLSSQPRASTGATWDQEKESSSVLLVSCDALGAAVRLLSLSTGLRRGRGERQLVRQHPHSGGQLQRVFPRGRERHLDEECR